MATVIENDLGRFEAETEKEVLALVRKAKREAKVKAAQDNRDSAAAYLHAESNAYKILRRVVSGEGMPNGWRVKKPGNRFLRVKSHADSFGRISDTATYESDSGHTDFEHYGYRVEGMVWNGAGFDVAVFLRDSTGERIEAYSVGVVNGQVRLADLPGVTIDMFKGD